MVKCPYCKKTFDYEEIIIGEARSLDIVTDDGQLEGQRAPNILHSHYILSCPHCETFLGCSRRT
jgi:uncharacterized protein YbaR (Trm112 family)